MALKRSHASSSQTLELPDLPKLSGDTLLEVFTHKNLRRADQEPFDNERLSLLGEKVLNLLVSDVLMDQRPMLAVSEIIKQQNNFFSPNTITLLVVHYGLLNHIRCLPDKASIFLNAPEEASSILHAYIGGIYVDHGDKPLRTVIQSWMNFVLALNVPPQKKIKMEETDRELRSPATSALGVSPTQLPNPLTPAQPNLPFLASFNQTSSKRGVTLDYPGTYDHVQKLWTVQCVVDGIIKGTGSGSSKSVAKELAARHAYQTMGWV